MLSRAVIVFGNGIIASFGGTARPSFGWGKRTELGAEMRWREFITCLSGATVAWPVVVRGQQSFILVLVLSVWIGIGTARVCHAAEQQAERSLSMPLDLLTVSDNCQENGTIKVEAIIESCTERIKSGRLIVESRVHADTTELLDGRHTASGSCIGFWG
jgi:hypothetical protein